MRISRASAAVTATPLLPHHPVHTPSTPLPHPVRAPSTPPTCPLPRPLPRPLHTPSNQSWVFTTLETPAFRTCVPLMYCTTHLDDASGSLHFIVSSYQRALFFTL
eukprot:9072421-Pyramimonas_sp.AAC.1